MARLEYIDPADEASAAIRTRRGGVLRPLDQILLHSPPLADAWNTMLGAVREGTMLSGDVRETAILRIAVLNRARYEWDAHLPIAQSAGMSVEQLSYLEEPYGPSPLTAEQQIALEYSDALSARCEVSGDLFDRARHAFGDRGVVELTITVGAYNMVSRFLNALDITETPAGGGGDESGRCRGVTA